MTKYIYSNNGLSWRGAQDAENAGDGEVAFDHLATVGELQAAFAGYNAAVIVAGTPADLAAKIAAGIAITSTGTPALNATYALDDLTLAQIGQVAQDAAAGLGLPGGGGTFIYPDITGTPHTFTETSIKDVYKAMRNFMFGLETQAAIQVAGGTANWPANTATIA